MSLEAREEKLLKVFQGVARRRLVNPAVDFVLFSLGVCDDLPLVFITFPVPALALEGNEWRLLDRRLHFNEELFEREIIAQELHLRHVASPNLANEV